MVLGVLAVLVRFAAVNSGSNVLCADFVTAYLELCDHSYIKRLLITQLLIWLHEWCASADVEGRLA